MSDAAREIAAFDALKPRLTRLWSEVFAEDDQPYTSVVVPSVTLDPDDLVRTPQVHFYEEILLFLLIRLRNPRARVVYVTSQPIPLPVVDYYLTFLAGIPASHAAARLTLLSAYDGQPRPLTEKILERPRLVQRIRDAVTDPSRAYLTVLRSTALERRLAVALDLPLNAADPEMDWLCRKSGARRIFAEAGVPVVTGSENVRDETDVVEALAGLAAQRPGLRRAILKADTSYWDEGSAVVRMPAGPAATRDEFRRALLALELPEGHDRPSFLDRLARRGGVVEEFVEARYRADASVQLDQANGDSHRPQRDRESHQHQAESYRAVGRAGRGRQRRHRCASAGAGLALARRSPSATGGPCSTTTNWSAGGRTSPRSRVAMVSTRARLS